MRYTYILFLLTFSLIACDKAEAPFNKNIEDRNTIRWSGTHVVDEIFELNEGKRLVIEPGTTVKFMPGTRIIAFGDVYIEGTENERITLEAVDPIDDHRIIQTKYECKKLYIKHTDVINGLITSFHTENHFDNVHFTNNLGLEWNFAMARFWNGSVLIENCTADWNNQGEGILVHDTYAPIVRNNIFHKLPDAVEYINSEDGEITGNKFYDMNDDAIDQNGCTNTLIQNNEFYRVNDRALELGSEKFGRSNNLMVFNNLFVNCKTAINLKESSHAIVENATFVGNGSAIEVLSDVDSVGYSKLEIGSSVFYNINDNKFIVDQLSTLDGKDCLSNTPLPFFNNCLITDFTFVDPENANFEVVTDQLPEGYTIENIGYQSE